jgi:nucleotide-binding universal stress UspA family protein
MGATSTPAPVAAPAAIRNILFATDFSPCADSALPFATALARRHRAAVFVMHVLAPEPRYELPLEPEPDAMNTAKQAAVHQLEALLQSKGFEDVVHAGILRRGEFTETLADVIAERNIDLIVAGTHGREGLSKMVLGSTAELIFRNACCPVLTVGPHVKPEVLTSSPRQVLFATDFSQASQSALRYAIWMAQQECGSLTLFHAVSPVTLPAEAVVVPAIEPRLVEDARIRLLPLLKKAPLSVPVQVAVTVGPAAEMIVETAQQSHATLIVLGIRHKGKVATHLPWSVTDVVTATAPCPVLTVRGD